LQGVDSNISRCVFLQVTRTVVGSSVETSAPLLLHANSFTLVDSALIVLEFRHIVHRDISVNMLTPLSLAGIDNNCAARQSIDSKCNIACFESELIGVCLLQESAPVG